MVFLKLWKTGFRTRQAFNAHRDKKREGRRGTCMARAHDVTRNQGRRHGNPLRRIPGNHERGATGHNTLPPRNWWGRTRVFQIKLQRCGLPIWQGAANINTFCNTRPQRNCHSAVRVDPKNVKGSSSFWFKFAIKRFIIFQNLLTNLVVKIDSLFVGTKQCVIDQLFSSS